MSLPSKVFILVEISGEEESQTKNPYPFVFFYSEDKAIAIAEKLSQDNPNGVTYSYMESYVADNMEAKDIK